MQVSPLRRERKKRGWSLERAASELCKVAREHGLGTLAVDGTTLGRYERGTIHFPREPVPEAMSLLYGRPVHVLWPEQAWYEVTQDQPSLTWTDEPCCGFWAARLGWP